MHPAYPPSASKPLVLVVAAGGLAGALDIAFAILYWAFTSGVPASRILQSVAAGVLGAASFERGTPAALLGLALHFLIAIGMAAAYYMAARRLSPLREAPLFFGAAYGLLLYVIMQEVVVPLSRASPATGDPWWVMLGLAAHIFLVGIPIAFLVGRAAVARPR